MDDFATRLTELMAQDVTTRRAEMRRVGHAMRDVIDRLVATKAPLDVLEEAAVALEAVAASLARHPRGSVFEGFAESATAGDPHAPFDHSPLLGHANPLAPPIAVSVEDGVVVGRAHFGSAYQGPPNCVHGGFVAAAFDEVLGVAQSMSGAQGMTGTLTVRYRRPTPLHEDLRFEGRLERVEGRKVFTRGEVFARGELTAEAEAIFITIDAARVRALLERER